MLLLLLLHCDIPTATGFQDDLDLRWLEETSGTEWLGGYLSWYPAILDGGIPAKRPRLLKLGGVPSCG